MKRISMLVLLLTAIGGTVVAQQSTGESATWKRYTVKGEEFSVKLPTLPALTTSHHQKTETSSERWEWRLGAYADGVVYTIYILDDGDPKKALENSVQGTGSHFAGDRNSEQKLTQDGFTGKQILAPHPLGATAQLFATKKRYYNFEAVGAPSDDPRVKQFFSSLSLGKSGEAIEVTDGDGIPWDDPAEAADPAGGENFYTGKGVDRRPFLIMKIEPSYTEDAKQAQITGTVVLKAVFRANGSVTNLRIVSALPHGLTEKAITATRRIKFIPAVKDGKFVSMWMQFEYNFNLF